MEQRLIDANALYKKLENKYKGANGGLLRLAYKDAIDDVCNAPTIDPVKHGRWVITDHDQHCGLCGFVVSKDGDFTENHLVERLWHYCPNCGARMDGGTP